MNVSYTLPLRNAWSRMVRLLFRPFRIEFWLVLGFAAFLSEYLGEIAGHELSFEGDGHRGHGRRALRRAAHFLLDPAWGPLVVAVVVLSVIATLLFLWVSSRGKFIFLDNVVHERTGIVEPWGRFARHGNSLFAFWILSGIVCVLVFVLISLPLLPALLAAAAGGGWKLLSLMTVAGWLAAVCPLVILAAYAYLFLFQFVVPIMYRHDLGVMAAWRKFLGLFREHPSSFLAYGLFYLVLMLPVGVGIATVGLATCCVGFFLLWLPYAGSVILLPVEVTFRGLGPDFLAQFGPEWSLLPAAPAPAGGASA